MPAMLKRTSQSDTLLITLPLLASSLVLVDQQVHLQRDHLALTQIIMVLTLATITIIRHPRTLLVLHNTELSTIKTAIQRPAKSSSRCTAANLAQTCLMELTVTWMELIRQLMEADWVLTQPWEDTPLPNQDGRLAVPQIPQLTEPQVQLQLQLIKKLTIHTRTVVREALDKLTRTCTLDPQNIYQVTIDLENLHIFARGRTGWTSCLVISAYPMH